MPTFNFQRPNLRRIFENRLKNKPDLAIADGHNVDSEERILDSPEWQHLLFIIRKWTTFCVTHHHTIYDNFYVEDLDQPLSTPRPPTRLVEVGDNQNDNHLRLVSWSEVATASLPKYATLSYCWGNANHDYKTTIVNVEERSQSIAINSLPATIKDAIYLCRKLSIGYLWVDALCIVQKSIGDEGDWASESLRMNEYFRHSYLTIAVLEAAASDVGFLKYDTPRNAWDDILRGADVYPLFKRGWALQEHILSRRILYITN